MVNRTARKIRGGLYWAIGLKRKDKRQKVKEVDSFYDDLVSVLLCFMFALPDGNLLHLFSIFTRSEE